MASAAVLGLKEAGIGGVAKTGENLKITDLKVATIGKNPVVRIVTDAGLSGFGEVEFWKPYVKPQILALKDALVGQDPTNVERCMLRIRSRGAFKPHGAAISVVEHALWDVAGKAAGVPVYKLLGGKIRDKVRVYNGAIRFPFKGKQPEDYAEDVRKMKAAKEGFTIVKQTMAFHDSMKRELPGFTYGDVEPVHVHGGQIDRGKLTEKGIKHIIACIEAMKEVLGDEVGLALDCGPGWMVPDAIRVAKAVEHLDLMWLEDMIAGDYTPYPNPGVFREVTRQTSTPIHTGEQIYLRQNFKDLIEMQAVNVVGPDPCDVGGIAELKWIAEFADLHGIMMAPHGTANGLLGLAALVQVSATLPHNFIAFEYPIGDPAWWYDIVDGLPDPIVRDGMIEVWDRPGMGIEINPEKAERYLAPEDKAFFR
jgi:L-alanine-DL-glutamate epimerase-like enolase superfamily enzyme